MISCRDLATGYGKKTVGSAIDLDIRPGEILCLLGPNGCGKTTLFKTILGLIPALGGAVEIGGQPLAALSRADIARQLAYVPQQHAPPFPFEVIEVVMMGRTPLIGRFAQPSAMDRDIALDALAQVGLADAAGNDYSRLSGGQRQLVLIARALAQAAPVLVMDEPTASLDFGNQIRVLEKVTELCRSGTGKAVIFSTHDPDQAFALEARVLLMRDGGIHATGAPAEVLTDRTLSLVYGADVVVEKTASGRRVCLPALRPATIDPSLINP